MPEEAKEVNEEEIGKVTHFFPKVSAAGIEITSGTLNVGDTIHIKGHTTDFKQKVASMQIDGKSVPGASKGDEIGILVKKRVRSHDVVYKVS